jgi:hypothetical protein
MRRSRRHGTNVATLVALSAAMLHAANRMPLGGGTTKAGLYGEYFANPSFQGKPAFTRRDVRIHHVSKGTS